MTEEQVEGMGWRRFARHRQFLLLEEEDRLKNPDKVDYGLARVSQQVFFLFAKLHNMLARDESELIRVDDVGLEDFVVKYDKKSGKTRRRAAAKVPSPQEYYEDIWSQMTPEELEEGRRRAAEESKARWAGRMASWSAPRE
jgi:hypothetical protein